MTIRRLPRTVINRIAAGEVVERPASAVKELVENALDAGATRIDVAVEDGGRGLIRVRDDGGGMTGDELLLAVERHATSKLADDSDLSRIATLGFRGEALPAIGAAARLALTSRVADADTAWTLTVDGGEVGTPTPAAGTHGTTVEVRDLFFATPARLKFLKAPRTELAHAVDAVTRLAMAHPHVAFTFKDGTATKLDFAAAERELLDATLIRLRAALGRDFADNACAIAAERGELRLGGHAALPTYNRANAQQQYLFVNGRPVRDRLLHGAVRAAYQDFLARDRHPVLALVMETPAEFVDVNVHPAKIEVRFRDPGLVRGLIVSALKHALAAAGHRAATTVSAAALGAMRPGTYPYTSTPPRGLAETAARYQAPHDGPLPGFDATPVGRPPAPEPSAPGDHPLGAARAQLHATYIVAQTEDGIVIVDQHAAHERLVYERVKAALANGGVARQGLLIPEVVELPEAAASRLAARTEELAELGLVLEAFGPGAVVVRETPALLGQVDVRGLVHDLADDLAEAGSALGLKDRLDAVCGTMSCHGSIRAGRLLAVDEMDALLRQMEITPHAGQCTHGRPTYVELKLADIERLFGRR